MNDSEIEQWMDNQGIMPTYLHFDEDTKLYESRWMMGDGNSFYSTSESFPGINESFMRKLKDELYKRCI